MDFVCTNAPASASGIAYYQVAATVLDENTLRRELEPLQKIRDNYPKYLLTLDEYMPDANYDGIVQMNGIDWLLGAMGRHAAPRSSTYGPGQTR